MVIHYTNIYNNVVFPGKKACIFRFKGRKSCANGDSVTLEFMIGLHRLQIPPPSIRWQVRIMFRVYIFKVLVTVRVRVKLELRSVLRLGVD